MTSVMKAAEPLMPMEKKLFLLVFMPAREWLLFPQPVCSNYDALIFFSVIPVSHYEY